MGGVPESTNISPNHYDGHSEPVTLIGIHTMEAPEAGDTAENVAQYFHNPAVEASAHWCVDNNSRVRVVYDDDSAWAMPPTNHYSLNIEQAGYAGQSAPQWNDAYSIQVMDIASLCAAEWCIKFDIPVRRLTTAQILNKEKGLAGHVDVNNAFHASDHTDPGPNFPWAHFLDRVNFHINGASTPDPTPAPSPGKPNCTELQRAVHTTADNMWGPNTDKNCSALIAASAWGGSKFPYGVKFTQMVVGTAQDGIWGPISGAAHDNTVMKVQTALIHMGFNPGDVDGIWGSHTNQAYTSARNACHI